MKAPATCASLAFLVIIAGCAAPDPSDETIPAPTELVPYLLDVYPVDLHDHDHADPAIHDASYNVAFVAHHPCTQEGTGKSAVGGYTDIAFHGKLAFVGNSKGFCTLDITDPAHPVFLSQYAGEPASDLEVSSDGKVVYLLTQRNDATGPATEGGVPGTDDVPRGVIVVDVTTPQNPTFASFYPILTNGVHTATPYRMGTRELLFIQSYDWFPPQGITPGGAGGVVPTQNLPYTQRIEIAELGEVNGDPTLSRVGQYSLARPPTEPFVHWFPHDAVAQFHPLLQKHLLYVAYWDAGLVILDISDPSKPALWGQNNDKAPSVYQQAHDVKVFPELLDGVHITVTGPELSSGPEAGVVRVYNTSDPAKPVQLGTWRLPENPGTPGGFLYSPHVFTLDPAGRIYIGHNHGGVWVIDVHNQTRQVEPVTMGFFLPRGNEATGEYSNHLHTWGAYLYEGLIYATEGSGVHVLRYAGDVEASTG